MVLAQAQPFMAEAAGPDLALILSQGMRRRHCVGYRSIFRMPLIRSAGANPRGGSRGVLCENLAMFLAFAPLLALRRRGSCSRAEPRSGTLRLTSGLALRRCGAGVTLFHA